ncbi:MAG: hypothetical protein GY820_23470 [Gammaproteobacteria bacterium]|nr:hypothetical protein [Gammaproteobacteria bacterium]
MPQVFELAFKYLVTFSMALGLLNSVPCYSLDGQFIWGAVLLNFARRWARRRGAAIYKLLMIHGTILLVFCA